MESSPRSSGTGSTPSVEIDLEEKRAEILQKIVKITDESQELWRVLAAEQQSCCVLILMQTFLSERFTEFHDIWRSINFEANIPLHGVLDEINVEVTELSNFLATYENRTQKTSTILRDMTNGFTQRLKELHEAQEACLQATRLDELEMLRIPDMSSIKNMAYPDLTELNAEWEEFNLDGKLDKCFEDIECLNFC